MIRRIWQVYAEVALYVYADDIHDAERVTLEHLAQATVTEPVDCEISEARYVPERAVVYGRPKTAGYEPDGVA
jgi:hypothetical protein